MAGRNRLSPRAGWFAAGDRVVVRAALAPRGEPGPADPREPEDPGRLAELAGTFLGRPSLAAALELASPGLAASLSAPLPERAADRRRMTIALTGYGLRSQYRATPFGLFAGTAVIPVGETGGGQLGDGDELHVRPGPTWLAALVAGLEADPALTGLAPAVRLAAASALHRAGSRVVLLDRAAGGPGHWQARRLVRRSRLLDAVLAVVATSRGLRGKELADLLCAAVPAAGPDEIARYVAGLLTAGILVTDLLPPPGHADPLGHLTRRLGTHPLAPSLRGARSGLGRLALPARAAGLRERREELRAISAIGADAGLVADSLLVTDLQLPRAVAREVERAAAVAWACGPMPSPRPLGWLHEAILQRYGTDRPVPLPELLSLTGSFGLPARGAKDGQPASPDRDRMLRQIAVDALAAGRVEFCVDGAVSERLGTLSGERAPAPSMDLFAEVITCSQEALARGEFLVALGTAAGPGPAGAVAGRLAPLLGEGAAGLAGRPGVDDGGPLDVEVVFRPPGLGDANLVSETGWTEFGIDLTDAPRPRRPGRYLSLDELDVVATTDRLLLRADRLGRTIRAVSFTSLHPGRADTVARLLLAIAADGTTSWRAWDWGAARHLRWLPRVRAGRAILAPQRWAIPSLVRHLAAAGSDRQFGDGLRRWREEEGLPGVVVAGAWDKRLPLDLSDPVHVALLRRECRDHGVRAVTEPPGGELAWRAIGWPRGPGGPRAAEFVIPLRWTGRPAPVSRTTAAPVVRDTVGPDTVGPGTVGPAPVVLPGGSWLCASLAAPGALHDGLLAELGDPALSSAARQASVDRWFYVRTTSADGLPQVVLRFHGPAAALNATLLPALHDWSGRLRAAGLLRDFALASYWPETWRYGGPHCLAAAEEFFCCDSRVCAATLAAAPGTMPPEQLAVPGVGRIMAGLLGADAAAALPGPRLSAEERRLHDRLRPAIRAAGEPGWPSGSVRLRGAEDQSEGQSVGEDWCEALSAYRDLLSAEGRDPRPIASSLVHMHCNRMAGPLRSVERVAVALARDLLLARSTR